MVKSDEVEEERVRLLESPELERASIHRPQPAAAGLHRPQPAAAGLHRPQPAATGLFRRQLVQQQPPLHKPWECRRDQDRFTTLRAERVKLSEREWVKLSERERSKLSERERAKLSEREWAKLAERERFFLSRSDWDRSTSPGTEREDLDPEGDRYTSCGNYKKLRMREEDDSSSTQSSLQVVRDILNDVESMEDLAHGGLHDRPLSQGDLGGHMEDKCSVCRLPGSTDLVVDIHLESSEETPRPCVKHSYERFPRCYSESRGNLSRDEFRNLDKIETIGEERLRHMSEGAGRVRRGWGFRGTARGVFCSDKGPLHQQTTCHLERKYQISENESSPTASNLGSTEDLDSVDGGCAGPVSGNKATEVKLEPRSRPEVKFQIFDDTGAASDSPDSSLEPTQMGCHANTLKDAVGAGMNSYKTTMSSSSSTTSMPICRICQLPSIEPSNHLISPCRCLGSIRYVHNPCLLKWLEVCSRKNSDAPCCELCQFQYLRKKRFVLSHCMFPTCSGRDRVLHSIFLLSIALMVTCAGVTILCFKQDRDNKPKSVGPSTELTMSELMTLSCGVLFFMAFFVAMYVEVKAKNTVYQLICKFLYMNYDWTIQEYDRRKDPAKQLDDS